MRHPKNNIRSFRFSNEVAQILEDHNNNFEELVLDCYYRLPEVEEELKRLEEQKKSLECEIFLLYLQRADVIGIIDQMICLKKDFENLHERIDKFIDT